MNLEAVHHENFGVYACPESEDVLELRLRTARDDVSECLVYYVERYDYTPCMMSKKMEHFAWDMYYDYFRVSIRMKSKRFKYFFRLTDSKGKEVFYLGDRFAGEFPENTLNGGFFQYPYINTDELPDMPAWAKEAVFYQIFPDRFCRSGQSGNEDGGCENGRKDEDPGGISRSGAGLPKPQPWGTKPGRDSFFGGDIQGIAAKLDYLKELGVNAIYMTPIFLSDSNHKYDTIDYYTIDPAFGTLQDMKDLVEKAHKRGIRVVFDAVFNHCSDKNGIFMDVVEKGSGSPYASWFYFDGFPVVKQPVPNYETFGVNIHTMPRFNTANPEVRDYLAGVAEYWTRELDIDGWRLDVADEVSHGFWKEFRKQLKAVKKDVLIIGEVWYRATPWLMGDEFDSVMNYPFRQAVIDFVVNREIDGAGFIERINAIFIHYRSEAPYYLLNLLGSHDTARFFTICGGDESRMRLAVILTMTFVGIPMIYYGDEIGMDGMDDPDCRRTMIWDMEAVPSPSIFGLYRKLIRLRRENPVLMNGRFKPVRLPQSKNLAAFIREDEGAKALVVLNNGDTPVKIELQHEIFSGSGVSDCSTGASDLGGSEIHELLYDRRYCLNAQRNIEIVLDAMDAAIFIAVNLG